MTRRSEQISLHLNAYLTAHSSPPDAVLRELANETADLFPFERGLAIPPEQGTLMTLLTQLTRATSAIEIGTFTGYSSICIAPGLADGGQVQMPMAKTFFSSKFGMLADKFGVGWMVIVAN